MTCATWSPHASSPDKAAALRDGDRRRHARRRIGRRRRVPPQHGRRAAARGRPRAVGRGLLLPDAAARGAPYWEAVLPSRQGAGRARAKPLPRCQRRRALGLRRLRLHGAARGPAGRAWAAASSTVSTPAARETLIYTPHVASSSLQALLARAQAALERGRGPEAVQLLGPALRSATLHARRRTGRCARRWPRRGCCRTTSTRPRSALGRTPDTFRDTISAGRLSTLWRLHGRLASTRGDQSRAIALHGRALKQAETAHDSRAIGLAHYELGQCYRQVGDVAIVREHITKAASALHAAGDRRHLALVHSLSSISLAQLGRYDEAMTALRQAERLASLVQADDVAGDGVRQPGERDDARAPLRAGAGARRAQRLAARGARIGTRSGGRARHARDRSACALGDLRRAEDALHRALDVRSPIQFHETTGAVFDTLAQIHLIRGRYDAAGDFLARASDAYGAYGRQTSQWYEWSVRVLCARLALRSGAPYEALPARRRHPGRRRAALRRAAGHAHRGRRAHRRRPTGRCGDAARRRRPKASTRDGAGDLGRVPAAARTAPCRQGAAADAYHDFAQSATLLDLLGERYQAALSHLALGRLVAQRRRAIGRRAAPRQAGGVFTQLGAERDLQDTEDARALLNSGGTGRERHLAGGRRRRDRAADRRCGGAARSAGAGDRGRADRSRGRRGGRSICRASGAGDDVRIVAAAGCDEDAARALVRAYLQAGRRCGPSVDATVVRRASRSDAMPTAR